MLPTSRQLLGCVLLALASSLAAGPPQVRPLTGKPLDATLLTVDAGWQLRFRRTGAQGTEDPQTIPAADLIAWGAPAETTTRAQLLLADGGLLVADVLKLDKERLQVDSPLFGVVTLPIEQVQGILFHPATAPADRDRQLQRLAERNDADGKPLDADRLIFDNADQLLGTVLSLDDRRVGLQTAAGLTQEVDVAKLSALAFNPALVTRPTSQGMRAWVGFQDGSRLLTGRLEVDEMQARLNPSAGGSWNGGWRAPREAIVSLQPLGGKAVYVSDLPVASYRHVPFLAVTWPFALDRSVTGSQLRAGGRLYAKGVGMHSAARLTWALDKPYRRFEASIAIDDQTAGRGSVTFRVFVDREERFTSPVIHGGQAPQAISVDVSGGKQLSLLVDFAERGDELDRADWLDARLVE